MNDSPRITLADVARLAGVSKATASMALSNVGRVSASTRAGVQRAAEDLGYVPHFAASSLRSQRVDTIAVVLPHAAQHVFSHPVFIDLLEGISVAANELDLAVLLSTARSKDDEASAYSRIIRGRQAAGVIVAAASVSDPQAELMSATGYPVVVIGRLPHVSSVATVGVDDVGGARQAVAHLIAEHGARRIGHVSGPLDHQSSIDKRDGYLQALAAAGLTMNPRLTYEGDYEEPSGAAAALKFLPHLGECDALFFANDQMAIGALDVFAARGISVPQDLRVVSYDNEAISRRTAPPLTTVSADMSLVGRSAVDLMNRMIQGDGSPGGIEYPTELIVRQSCGCSPAP